jgi:hypothetical protein
MEGVLVGGASHDRIYIALEREFDGALYGMAGKATGADDAMTVVPTLAAALLPATDREAPDRGNGLDLIVGADDRDVRIERLGQGSSDDLGSDAAGIAKGYRDSWSKGRSRFRPFHVLTST